MTRSNITAAADSRTNLDKSDLKTIAEPSAASETKCPADVTTANTFSTTVIVAAKVFSARSAGIADVSFYHYGFMRLENLAWVREALQNKTGFKEIP